MKKYNITYIILANGVKQEPKGVDLYVNDLKQFREDKHYLFMGVDFDRDTFRMVANELTIGLQGGYLVTQKKTFTKKEEKFLKNHSIERIEFPLNALPN